MLIFDVTCSRGNPKEYLCNDPKEIMDSLIAMSSILANAGDTLTVKMVEMTEEEYEDMPPIIPHEKVQT